MLAVSMAGHHEEEPVVGSRWTPVTAAGASPDSSRRCRHVKASLGVCPEGLKHSDGSQREASSESQLVINGQFRQCADEDVTSSDVYRTNQHYVISSFRCYTL